MSKRKTPQKRCVICGQFVVGRYLGIDQYSYLCSDHHDDYVDKQYARARKEFGK